MSVSVYVEGRLTRGAGCKTGLVEMGRVQVAPGLLVGGVACAKCVVPDLFLAAGRGGCLCGLRAARCLEKSALGPRVFKDRSPCR